MGYKPNFEHFEFNLFVLIILKMISIPLSLIFCDDFQPFCEEEKWRNGQTNENGAFDLLFSFKLNSKWIKQI